MVNKIPYADWRVALYRRLGIRFEDPATSNIMMGCEIIDPLHITIGAHTNVGRHCLLDGRGGLSIGNKVNISSYSLLITASHAANSPDFRGLTAPIKIGDLAWVASRALILPGVEIGTGAVVAAGAVVTKNVEPFTIVGGIPARFIGQRRTDLDYEVGFKVDWS